jgi:uncharacterized protein YbjT (DUF2867 family)
VSQTPTRIAVDGATGYVGNHTVAELKAQGFDVLCLVHAGAREKDVAFLRSLGAEIAVVTLDTQNDELTSALRSCTHAIHLIGSIAPKKGETLTDLHSKQTANLVKAAQAAGVRKLIQVTALGSAENAVSEYHRTKWQAEQHVRNSGLAWMIYRPSLIIGKTVGNRNSKLVSRYIELIETRPRVPVIGGGSNRVQPIFVGDLAKAIAKGISEDRFDNHEYELGGAEVTSMRGFVERLITLKGAGKSIAPIPWFAANILAATCELVQNVPLVSRDQVKLSQQDNVCASNALNTVFGITPTSINDALDTYKVNNSASEMATSSK